MHGLREKITYLENMLTNQRITESKQLSQSMKPSSGAPASTFQENFVAKQMTQKVPANEPMGKTTPKAQEEVLPQKSVKAAEPAKKEPAAKVE